MEDLIQDRFEFELPVWVLVDKDDVYLREDGKEQIRFPAKVEASSVANPPGFGPFVQIYTDEDLALRGLQSASNPNARAFAIRERKDFMNFLQKLLTSGIRYLGADRTEVRAALIDIANLLKQ